MRAQISSVPDTCDDSSGMAHGRATAGHLTATEFQGSLTSEKLIK
jgi:hypothetical protein